MTTTTIAARPCTGVMGWLAGHKWTEAGYVLAGIRIDNGRAVPRWDATYRVCDRCGAVERVAVLTREGE